MLLVARDRLLRRESEPVLVERLERLRSRKEGVTQQIEERRVAARFESDSEEQLDVDVLETKAATVPDSQKRRQKSAGVSDSKTEQESYTERLLKAKKKVWKDRDK